MSALCVSIDPNGFVVSSATPVDQCTSYVLLESSEWGGSSIWAIPPAGDVAAIWGFAFSVPVIVFLMAWSLGVILKMFR